MAASLIGAGITGILAGFPVGLAGGAGYGFGIRYGFERLFEEFRKGGPQATVKAAYDDLSELLGGVSATPGASESDAVLLDEQTVGTKGRRGFSSKTESNIGSALDQSHSGSTNPRTGARGPNSGYGTPSQAETLSKQNILRMYEQVKSLQSQIDSKKQEIAAMGTKKFSPHQYGYNSSARSNLINSLNSQLNNLKLKRNSLLKIITKAQNQHNQNFEDYVTLT